MNIECLGSDLNLGMRWSVRWVTQTQMGDMLCGDLAPVRCVKAHQEIRVAELIGNRSRKHSNKHVICQWINQINSTVATKTID